MKHLLIILSFLLLSSPVIGDNHKGETLYLWETSSGELWRGFGEKETHPIYIGDVENGVPNGVGIFTYLGEKYVGEWKDGKKHGQGTYSPLWYGGGGKYVGGWKDGYRNGQGTCTYSDGRKYEGEWKYSQKYNRGLIWNGTQTEKDGKINEKHVNGKVEFFK